MKINLFAVLALAASLSACHASASVVFEPGKCEIVIPQNACGVVQIAAEEAKTFLGESLGAEVPVVNAPTPGKASLVLGANEWSDAAGVTTNGLKRDAFRIRTVGGKVFVAGVDDVAADARKALARGGIWLQNFERATCFGVYEFLERFVGVRFYFPGELGTVVPRRARIVVPETDLVQGPDFTVRRYSIYDQGRWFEGENPNELRHPLKTRNWWRLRMETQYTPCCHGQNKFCFIQRFAKSHPEYFALLPDGRRHNSPKITYPGHPGQVCHSSAIWDEIYLDVKSYLTGEPASVREIPIDDSWPGDAKRRFGWGSNCQRREIVDVMPQDGMIKCSCEKCKAYYESTPDKISWASGLLWPNVAKLANRLKAEGVPGKVAMMAYSKYRHVPEVAIPDNVEVMVAERGPWTECDPVERKREMDEVKAWYDKLGGRKVWMWTYANRGNTPGLGGIPEMTPHAVGRFFQQLKPYIFGAFLESENDWSIFSYLNYYVFSKVCWDTSVDVDAIIAEHHRLMFGAAAAEMGKLYSELERIWLEKVAGRTLDTPLGPQSERPSEYDLFVRIYTPAVIDGMEALLDAAAAKVAEGSIESRRIAFVRENIFGPLARRARAYVDSIDVQKGLARDRASSATNLIGNGDFSAPKKGRQMGPWFGVHKPGVIELDDKVFTSAPYSMRIVPNTNESTTAVFFFRDAEKKPTMKPGKKYRLSYCIKIEDLKPSAMHGGAGVTIWDDKNLWFPVGSPFSGTQDWTYQSHEFTAGPNTGVSKTPYIYLRVGKATGTVWFDDVRLEEVQLPLPGEEGKVPALPPDPFPDRLSAYVWRNWGLVDPSLLAETVGATKSQLSAIAEEMGLARDPVVLPEWMTKGYITILRRNWHLLPYEQILKILGKTREELFFCLIEEDFLWVKLGRIKPFCEPLVYKDETAAAGKPARRRIAAILREEGLDPAATEEPRFSFIRDIASVSDETSRGTPPDMSPFGFRLIFSYFADYVDPLGDPAVSSYPDGLLQKLSREGVNAVWLHTILRTLAKDPKYPEFGEGSENRIANLRTLVARAAKYGIKVFLYMNEPRGMPEKFFAANAERQGFKGVQHGELFAMCTSSPEVRRWVRDSLKQVFSQVPGLGGIFTITMSENLTNCASRRHRELCPRCKGRKAGAIIAEINRTMVEGMVAGNPDAEALIWNWQWPKDEEAAIVAALPSRNCRIMAVSENAMKIRRGGVDEVENDYSISIVGPGENAKRMWGFAKARGIPCVAKVQAANSWELSPFPYIPVMDLVAQHAVNLANEGVDGVMLSWSLGCCPSPNLRVYRELRKGEAGKDGVLDRMAAEIYGAGARNARRAWKAFSDGFENYPFACSTLYHGPQHWGPANPLYARKTGWKATMVGIPYDDLDGWRSKYPPETYAELSGKVADGFDEGCRLMDGVAPAKELAMFRAEQMHFASCRDQALFVMARDGGDRDRMVALAKAELERAKRYWPIVRADSRIGYESSNHYFYIPRDVLEKVLSCRAVIDGRAGR